MAGRFWRRLFSGERRWAALGILAVLALWQAGHRAYGDFVLPSPLATLAALGRLTLDGDLGPAILTTTRDALSGFLAATLWGHRYLQRLHALPGSGLDEALAEVVSR